MTISETISFAKIDELYLDPRNPRLGREVVRKGLGQAQIMEIMDKGWELGELAVSFIESGYWVHEPLLVVEEILDGRMRRIVVEGNRRLAALKFLRDATNKKPASARWRDMAANWSPPKNFFEKIPCIQVSNRKDIFDFLGFRHVTGIKEWKPAEKAEYIAKLIDENSYSYDQVRRKIGSKAEAVRRNYISYRLLLQMEDEADISIEKVEGRFSVLFLSLRTVGVQKYLDINITAEPGRAKRPVPRSHLKNLARFALWLFGDERREPIVRDSRQVEKFAMVLEDKKAVEYLERTDDPSLDFAINLSGVDERDLLQHLRSASDSIRFALTTVHRHKKSRDVLAVAKQVAVDSLQLIGVFPGLREEVLQEAK